MFGHLQGLILLELHLFIRWNCNKNNDSLNNIEHENDRYSEAKTLGLFIVGKSHP